MHSRGKEGQERLAAHFPSKPKGPRIDAVAQAAPKRRRKRHRLESAAVPQLDLRENAHHKHDLHQENQKEDLRTDLRDRDERNVEMNEAQLRIGTSGWHYQGWRGDFYPASLPPAKMLSWYARHFDTVEINNTFYRLPTEEALLNWKKLAPPGFLFAVKGSRYITHMKRLTDPEKSVELFFSRVELLGNTLGPILFQLPPKWKANAERLAEFLQVLPRRHKYIIEFRDESWYVPQIYDLLRRHRVALCIHDLHGVQSPTEITTDFTYVRFHGTTGKYQGNYSTEMLEDWAKKIQTWQHQLSNIYVYFNNDVGGHAVRNALSLATMLGESVSTPEISPGKPPRKAVRAA
jgi:uncharacterized protein YecE (DUF72 family)